MEITGKNKSTRVLPGTYLIREKKRKRKFTEHRTSKSKWFQLHGLEVVRYG